MFNLEQAISHWRRELGPVGPPELLDELESHLRADIEQQLRTGIDAERAFSIAVERIGEPRMLRAEFKKAGARRGELIMAFIVVALVGFILWMSGFTFAQMQLSPGEQVVAYGAVISSLLVACGWRYAVPFLPVISSKTKRMAMGTASIATGIIITNLLSQFVLPYFEGMNDRQIPAVGFWLLFPIAVCACLGLGLMMSDRDREYWGMAKQRGIREQSIS